MQITGGAGSGWGALVQGAVVSMSGADAAQLLETASGLAGTLVKGGGIALGVAVAGAYLLLQSSQDRIPMTSMAAISTFGRTFNGIVLTERIGFHVDDQHLEIPVSLLRTVKTGGVFEFTDIELVDGSRYNLVKFDNPIFEVLSIAGKQTVDVTKPGKILGSTVEDVRKLRQNLTFALEHSADEIVRVIGIPTFNKYFHKD